MNEQVQSAAGSPLEHWTLSILGVGVILLMLAICIQVAASALDWNPLLRFTEPLPLFGDALTLNSLLELQWHLLVVIALLPAWLVWRQDRHVRVDFIYAKLSPGARRGIEISGHAVFTLPFLALCLPVAWQFAVRAYQLAETSRDGGLIDRFLIKSMLPLGLALLLIVVVIESIVLLRRLFSHRST